MHPSRAPSIAPGTFFVAQSWADCITNMAGFNLRQAHGLDLTGATQLQHLLTDAGEAKQANEIGQLITKAQHLSVNGW